MVARLFAVALVALTLAALAMVGVVAAIVTGLVALNVLAVTLGVVVKRRQSPSTETWPQTPPTRATRPIIGHPATALPASSGLSHALRPELQARVK